MPATFFAQILPLGGPWPVAGMARSYRNGGAVAGMVRSYRKGGPVAGMARSYPDRQVAGMARSYGPVANAR